MRWASDCSLSDMRSGRGWWPYPAHNTATRAPALYVTRAHAGAARATRRPGRQTWPRVAVVRASPGGHWRRHQIQGILGEMSIRLVDNTDKTPTVAIVG